MEINNPQDVLIATDEGMGIAEYQDGEIKILGVEEVIAEDGQEIPVVSVEMEREQALLIDINHDDVIDVVVTDADFSHTYHTDWLDFTNDVDHGAII